MAGGTKFTVTVVCGAAVALGVLGAWLVHPAMALFGEAGTWSVRFLMLAVVVAAVLALVFRRGPPAGGPRRERMRPRGDS